ncbi:MAG: sensor histidine kinase [Lachnospiraceae bacterium]|nr:sensor histidine kinase [Lachnospiraceae bacterium]
MKKFLYAGVTKWMAGILLLLCLGAGIYFGVWVMSAVSSGGMEVLQETVPATYFDSQVCLDSLAHAVKADILNEFGKQVYREYKGMPMATAMEIAYYDPEQIVSYEFEDIADLTEEEYRALVYNLTPDEYIEWDNLIGVSRAYTYKHLAELMPDASADVEGNGNLQALFQNEGVDKSNAYVEIAKKKLIEVIKAYGRKLSLDEYYEEDERLFDGIGTSEYLSDESIATTAITDESGEATEASMELPTYNVYVAEVAGSRWEYIDGTEQVRCSRFGALDTGEKWLFYNKDDLNNWTKLYGEKSYAHMDEAFLAVPVYYFDTLAAYYVSAYNTYMSYSEAVKQLHSGESNYRYEVKLDNKSEAWSNIQKGEDITKNNVLTWSCDLNGNQIDGTLTEANAQYLYDRLFSDGSSYSVQTFDGEVYYLEDYLMSHEAKITISVADRMEYNDFLSYGLKEFEQNRDLYRHAKTYLAYSVLLLMAALVLFAYLCLVVGYQDNNNTLTKMQVSFRVYTELILGLPTALLFTELLAGDMLMNSRDAEIMFGSRENCAIFIVILMCCSVLPFCFELLTRIRHKMFLQRSLCAHLVRIVWKEAFKLYKAIAQRFGERYGKMKAAGSNLLSAFRIDYRLSAAFVCSQIVLFILVMIGGAGFYRGHEVGMAALVLAFVIEALVFNRVFRDIRYTAEIIDGVAQLKEGNLDYKISTEHMHGHKRALAENINHLQNGLKLAVEQSLKDERLKTELITNVSHDIKTPLTSIINYVDLLKKEPMAGENSEHYLEVLDQKSQRLKQLMEDLVEVSKSSTGNVEFVPMRLDLIELLRQTLGEFEDKFKSRNLTVIENFKIDCAVVNLDSRHTFRVFENLCQNIYKYAMENSRIYVDVSEEAATVSVVMKNISQYELNISAEELMERFVRGDESRNTSGSGLGLSIARNLVTLQQGTFEITLDGDLFKVTVKFPLTGIKDGLDEPQDVQTDTGAKK